MVARDTSARAARVQEAILRRLGGARRLERALEMSDEARRIACDGIRARHPDYDEAEVRFALWRMLHGDALFRAAWPGALLLPP